MASTPLLLDLRSYNGPNSELLHEGILMALWQVNLHSVRTARLWLSALTPIVLSLLCWSTAFAAEPPVGSEAAQDTNPPAQSANEDDQPTQQSDTPTAKALIQKVYDDEAWLSDVDSFLLRSERIQTRTDEGMKPREMPAIYGGGTSTPSNRVLSINTLIAWDTERVMLDYRVGDSSRSLCTWDGTVAIYSSRRDDKEKETERVKYVLDDETDKLFVDAFNKKLLWGHAARRSGPKPWWRALERYEYEEVVVPSMIELIGREDYGGYDCYRIDVLDAHRYYIRVRDRRLIADVRVASQLSSEEDLKLRSEIAGKEIASAAEWQSWLKTLDDEKRSKALGRYWKERNKDGLVNREHFFDDYREVAPGCWFPYEQRTRTYLTESGKSVLTVHSDTTIHELKINAEIPDEIFEQAMVEGARVATDYRYEPWIRYIYHASQTEQDRQQLANDKRIYLEESERTWEDIKFAIDAQLGQEPPPLPEEGWIGSDPLTWDGLQGRAVALVFWDVDYGPSQQAFDRLQQLSDHDAGFAVIAVHRATDDVEKIEKYLTDQGWTFPVVIDGTGKENSDKSLFEWFPIQHVPWMAVIYQDGKFTVHDYPGMNSNIFGQFVKLSRGSGDNEAK